MKISQLTPATAVDRSMLIPVAIGGDNRTVTPGQILDEAAAAVTAEKERAEAAESSLQDGIDRGAALLAEANIRVFDRIILNRNLILIPPLEAGEIVYSQADNAFYRYQKLADLDPLAIGGGSSSKGQFWPMTDYMDGDAPSAAILYRKRDTAELYRYDTATASLVRHADASEVAALAERVEEAEAGVARLAPTLEKTRLRRAQRVPHLCTGRISINSVPGNVYRNKGFVTICRGIPYVSETPFYMYNYKQGAGKEHVDIVRLMGYTPGDLPASFMDDIIDRLYIFVNADPKVAPIKLTTYVSRQDLILQADKGLIGFAHLDLSDLRPGHLPQNAVPRWALAMKVDDMMPCGGSARHVTINKHGAIVEYKGAVPDRFKLGRPIFSDIDFYLDDVFYHCPTAGWKSFTKLVGGGQMQHSYKRHIVYERASEQTFAYIQRVWNPHPLQQQIKGGKESLRVRIRNKSHNGNVSDWIYCVLYKTLEPTGIEFGGLTQYKAYIVECPEWQRMGLINPDSPGIKGIGKRLTYVM